MSAHRPSARVTSTKRLLAVDLYSGAGGMSLGFEQAGFDVAVAVDYDPYHVATHKRNFPNAKVICGSVTELTAAQVRSLLGETTIDLIFGGPPCQGFSHMGLRDAGDPRNTLVDDFVRLVTELQPTAFVMENVPGMQVGATRAIFERAVESFDRAGYLVTEPVVTLNAKEFGVPQDRARLFILGVHRRLGREVSYPRAARPGQPSRPTVREAFMDLPKVDDDDRFLTEDSGLYSTEPAPAHAYARIARRLEEDPSDRSNPREWDKTRCTGCQRVRHAPEVVALYESTPPGRMVPGHKLPRLDPDGIAPTLRAGSNSERGSHTAPRPIHPFRPRCITAREAARLHGFPDWFAFYPGKWHSYQAIGNAVCPPVARAIGFEVRSALGLGETVERGSPVILNDNFELPDGRPKLHRRLPHIEEFPKVINWLLKRACGGDRKGPRHPHFSVEDVARAIRETGAELPRIRPDQFLSAVARSRNVSKILAPVRKLGLSIRALPSGGEFVPIDSPGTLEDKDTIQIRSNELTNASKLRVSQNMLVESPAAVLEHPEVARSISSGKWLSVRIERNLFGFRSGETLAAEIKTVRGRLLSGIVIVGSSERLPRRSRVTSVLKARSLDVALVVSRLTARHILTVLFTAAATDSGAREIARRVFMLATRANSGRKSDTCQARTNETKF